MGSVPGGLRSALEEPAPRDELLMGGVEERPDLPVARREGEPDDPAHELLGLLHLRARGGRAAAAGRRRPGERGENDQGEDGALHRHIVSDPP